jgi:8-oxo-dGTP diphosphatase
MRYSYCPICGKDIAQRERDVLICGACGYHFYQNSKPCVGAMIFRRVGSETLVLLTRRGVEPYKGHWDLPGGFLGNGEHPEEGLKREMEEELGVRAFNPRFLCLQLDEYPRTDIAEEARFVLCLFYLCEIPGDAVLRPADDVTEARWFPVARLPMDLAFPANSRAFREARALIDQGTAFNPVE